MRSLVCLALFFGAVCLTSKGTPAPGATLSQTPDRSRWPAALQQVPLSRLSSGALALLNRDGDLVQPSSSIAHSTVAPLMVALDLRVASDLRLGADPDGLPPAMRAQAEPHIARAPADPDFLAATFQEGRFTDGGAVDCGYSISHDGGLSWTRALIPNLTITSGGPYPRATDPVAAIDLDGRVFLNTEVSLDENFNQGAIAVSRSTDGGATFAAPVIVFQPGDDSVFPDKNWMAVNTFAGTPQVGRVLVTWTLFGTTEASPIYRSYSDDHGLTWSAPAPIHSVTTSAQGSQPMFLPDGRVAIVYWNFAGSGFTGGDAATALEEIDMVLSTDGGMTFGPPRPVATVTRYDQPDIRNGVFLPSATTDRTTGDIYVVYQGRGSLGAPRIFFTKSKNAGATWSAPRAITDNPGTGVFNAAIAVSPEGARLTASFYDQRDSGGDTTLCNLYLAESFDGGTSWEPNLRLTSVTTDASLAPLTADGFMLGDYLGIAESTSVDVPAVPVWVDTRTGNPDPFITRVGITKEVNFTGFQASRLSLGQIDDPQLGGTAGDADGDGANNLSEFLSQTEPNDPASVVHTTRQLNISTRENVGVGEDVLIGGFIISGTTGKTVLLRALGPSLTAAGLTGVLQDPVLELHDASNSIIAQNDNWKSTQENAIAATGIPPDDNREAALLLTLAPGGYTAVVHGQNDGVGTGLVEAYDLDDTPASRFGNISTRGHVGTDMAVLIGGLIVADEQSGLANVIVRALGPSLGAGGVTGVLQDPALELHDANGALLAENDNWRDTQQGIIASVGLAPSDDREAALFAELAAGEYTAVVRGVDDTTGVGLVEVFNIP